MTRYVGFVALATVILAGCAPSGSDPPTVFRLELPKAVVDYDPDLTPISLRDVKAPLPRKLLKRIERPDLSLKIRNADARLQFQLPLFPPRVPARLTAIARSYWEPDDMAEPSGKFLLRLVVPLSSMSRGSDNGSEVSDLRDLFERVDMEPVEIEDRRHDGVVDDELIDDWVAGYNLLTPRSD